MAVTLDNMNVKISELIENYTQEVKEEALNELDKTADEILDYVKNNAPRGKSNTHLADSFIKTEVGSGVNKVIYISSKTKSRLVHLIELGFKHRSGKHVAAQPFLRPAYDKFTPEMLEEIKRIISGGKWNGTRRNLSNFK